ncbi:stage II sporulation protein R [Heyndrickxia coagulans]|uniref:stage II sporulation protein R n=1 Tax=Heyndrickxia coagulans TaxID=1398 RepID=UPI0028113822|nr:stage II sporulation protein R [Heyndrickxia coagulans]WMM88912.1 stage II sporulation protein R [Heyndrickxia coagulans]
MKRKTVVSLYIFMLSIATIISLYAPKQKAAEAETIVIPKDAIRLRILANSDKPEDQAVKRKIRDEVNANITKWVGHLNSKKEAEKVIRSHLPEIESIARRVMAEEQLNEPVKAELGKVAFPTKLYGQYLYPAGKYEAVLITLGEGKGANWWCVLYPPLCFLDFSNGVATSSRGEEKKPETKKVATSNARTKPAEEATEKANRKPHENQAEAQDRETKQPAGETATHNSAVYAGDDGEVEKKLLIVKVIKELF